MRTGWKTRGLLIMVLFLYHAGIGIAGVWLEVNLLNNGRNLNNSSGSVTLNIMTHEIIGIELIGHFANDSDDRNFIGWMRPWYSNIPNFVDGWQEQSYTLVPGEEVELRNVIYIRPLTATVTSFAVGAGLRGGESSYDPLTVAPFKFYVRVNEATHDYPTIIQEPLFSRGLTNTISWISAKGSTVQDVYYFEKEDRENLQRSVQGLYRMNHTDTLQSVVENLVDGHTYGYFVKAVHETPQGSLELYSDIVYSTQDNTPPYPIVRPQALIKNDNSVELTWMAVMDDLSGVARYKIYRVIDTGVEKLLADSAFVGSGPLKWVDNTAISGFTYYYRICAVDLVGNEGYGERSNSITLGGEEDSYPPPRNDTGRDTTSFSEADSIAFLRGVKDTLWIELDTREEYVRFEAVRDSIHFFNSPPSIKMRYFDSGWVPPDLLRGWGWMNPGNPDSVFFVFDYTDTGGIHADSEGVVHYDTNEVHIDANFVNEHTYIRRAIRRYYTTTDTMWFGEVVSDCFSPEDIHNLRIEAVIDDPDFQDPAAGYTSWHLELSWNPVIDAVSGLKQYTVYRKIDGLDPTFMKLTLPDDFTETFLKDSILDLGSGKDANAVVRYRVVSEDNVGNIRRLDETNWEVQERALWSPFVVFEDTSSPDIYPLGQDTIFTNEDFVTLRLKDFNTSEVWNYVVSINGVEQSPDDIVGQDIMVINLPEVEVSHIKLRALYLGERSSIWSHTKIVIRAMDKPPENVTVWNDSSYWKGHIHLQWVRPSLDAVSYEVWRWNEAGDSSLVGVIPSKEDTILWTDYSDQNEISDEPSDTLRTYEIYTYRVCKINVFNSKTGFSEPGWSYCNRPPVIDFANVEIWQAENVITIHWSRVEPTLAAGSWSTRVRVSRDIYSNIIYDTCDTTQVIDATDFSFVKNIESGHNYIFQIQETPEYPEGRPSSWSKPYTVNLISLDSLFVQPQPKGHIFISWEEDTLVDNLPVDSFELYRISTSDTTRWSVPKTTTSYMDPVDYLEHGQKYRYRVTALNDLGQVLSTNIKEAVCDTGDVYIPEVIPFQYRYFHSDSIGISWQWRDIEGEPVVNSTRGAHSLRIQVSLSNTFPQNNSRTTTTDWFFAISPDSLNRWKNVKVPVSVSSENEKLYCRITAKDRWNHPVLPIWSNEEVAIFDPVSPNPVRDLTVTSTEAYYGCSDTIITYLQWSGEGVEWPENDTTYWNSLVGNTAYYRIVRECSSEIDTVGKVSVGTDVYEYPDMVRNIECWWRVLAVDSAGNSTQSHSVSLSSLVPTPDSPYPTGFKECTIQPVESDSMEYFVEIAMHPSHFRVAYEMEIAGIANRLLCQSGWIGTTHFVCTSGWGSIKADTTWFRVKARKGEEWESGWSKVVFYTVEEELPKDSDQTAVEDQIPRTFGVKQNFPNPFNAETVISYRLPEPGFVEICVYNVRGSIVKILVEGEKSAGKYSVVWDGTDSMGMDTASGIYLAHVVVKTEKGRIFQKQLKMMMIK